MYVLDKIEEGQDELIDLLTSARAIAERKGADTAWERFSQRLAEVGIGSVTAKPFKVLSSDIDALSATPSDGCGKGRTDKPLREKSDECPYEVPAFEMPKKPQGKYPYFWWSWHPNYPYWSKSCWGGNTVDLALKALKEPHACSMRYYHNVLVDDETGKVVHELPCQRLDVWREIAKEAASSSGEEGGR